MNNLQSKRIKASQLVLIGTICGDIIVSCYEWQSTKRYDFKLLSEYSRFTDDTVCSVAMADALVRNIPFDIHLKYWCKRYPRAGYGRMFRSWIYSFIEGPYNSWGNGSAMRVSSIGAFADNLDDCLSLAKQSAEITHNHPDGIKGAQAVASSIFLALHGYNKNRIKEYIENQFAYNLSRRYEEIQPSYQFEISCQKSVPESLIAFLESTDYESAVRKSVAFGGDADTMAAIAGGIAAAYYGEIPQFIIKECLNKLPNDIKDVINQFNTVLDTTMIR